MQVEALCAGGGFEGRMMRKFHLVLHHTHKHFLQVCPKDYRGLCSHTMQLHPRENQPCQRVTMQLHPRECQRDAVDPRRTSPRVRMQLQLKG